MEKEVIALIYNFLTEKDRSLAEIFKRQFNPDLNIVADLPSLVEIVNEYIKKTKKDSAKNKLEDVMNTSQISSMIQNTKRNASEFLERIVAKQEVSEHTSDTETEDELQLVSTDSSPEMITSAAKRRRSNVGVQKIWEKKSKN